VIDYFRLIESRMRPQQQNRRMRGRNGGGNNNNNNRRGPNPLTRSYESNGPDVKIRGTAQQVAEKYAALARDAMSSGDRVMAENYLQHAEHYNRIIMAAQAQFASQQIQTPRDEFDDDLDDGYGFEGGVNGSEPHPQPQNQQGGQQHSQQNQPRHQHQPVDGSGPQPEIEGVPAEVALNSDAGSEAGTGGKSRDRRHYRDRFDKRQQENRANGTAVEASAEQPTAPGEAVAEQPVAEVTTAVEPAVAAGEAKEAAVEDAPAADAAPRRTRRPRRPRKSGDDQGAAQEGGPSDTLASAEG